MTTLYEQMKTEKTLIRIKLIQGLIGMEGNLTMGNTSIDKEGGVTLSGYYRNSDNSNDIMVVRYFIDTSEIQELVELNTVEEVYEYYEGMGYFKEV